MANLILHKYNFNISFWRPPIVFTDEMGGVQKRNNRKKIAGAKIAVRQKLESAAAKRGQKLAATKNGQ